MVIGQDEQQEPPRPSADRDRGIAGRPRTTRAVQADVDVLRSVDGPSELVDLPEHHVDQPLVCRDRGAEVDEALESRWWGVRVVAIGVLGR